MTITRSNWEETEFRGQDLSTVLSIIKNGRGTGQLVLHFSQGTLSVAIWREKHDDAKNTLTARPDLAVPSNP
jgi:hypothetical protein